MVRVLGRVYIQDKRQSGREVRKRFSERLDTTVLAMSDSYCKVDYKVPLKRGGKVELQNVQVLCPPCFDGKTHADLTDAEWRARGCPQRQGHAKPIKEF